MPFDKLQGEVIDSGLCCSCGTCVSACPLGHLTIPLGEVGSEKKTGGDNCPDNCYICFEACPGRDLPFSEMEQMIFGRRRGDDPNEQMFGIYKQHMVTHAVDDQIHQTGVAGASVSALLINGLETGFLDAAIVAGYDKEKPWQVRPFLVTEREGVLAAARSKYGVCSIHAYPVSTGLSDSTGFACARAPS